MNETLTTLQNHRTIRRFQDKPIPEDLMGELFNATLRTASSRATQNASIIRVRDLSKRKALAAVSAQAYTAEAPEYLVFIVDCARAAAILQERRLDCSTAGSLDYFREGFTDAVLMCQSTVVGAESLGLGTTILGSILNDPLRTIEVLELPKYTFPVLGLILGYPDEAPELKPRIPQELRVMTNSYGAPASWSEALVDYDEEMHNYYDLRTKNQREDTFTNQIVKKMGASQKGRILQDAIISQGFHLGENN